MLLELSLIYLVTFCESLSTGAAFAFVFREVVSNASTAGAFAKRKAGTFIILLVFRVVNNYTILYISLLLCSLSLSALDSQYMWTS